MLKAMNEMGGTLEFSKRMAEGMMALLHGISIPPPHVDGLILLNIILKTSWQTGSVIDRAREISH